MRLYIFFFEKVQNIMLDTIIKVYQAFLFHNNTQNSRSPTVQFFLRARGGRHDYFSCCCQTTIS